MYSLFGIATGSVVSTLLLLVADQFRSKDVKARTYSFYVSENKSICQGDTVSLKAYGGDIYEWAPVKYLDNANSATPIASPNKTTTYTATIYKKQERVFGESGRHLITSELLNSKERIFYRKEIKLQAGVDYLLTLNARTLSALDKGLLEIIVNRKLAGKYFINNYFRNGFQFVWRNQSADAVNITMLLTHYDGDGDIIEVSEFSVRPVVKQVLSTVVNVRTDCSKCKAPEIISHKVTSTNAAVITLSNTGPSTIRFKKEQDTDWQMIETSKNSVTLTNLQEGANYVIEASTVCDKSKSEKSNWSNSYILKSSDRIIENVLAEKGRVYRGLSMPVMITPDSSGTHLHTYFKIDSPESMVKVEVWDAAGNCFYTNNIGIDNSTIQQTLTLNKNMTAGNYVLRIIDGTKSYNNQFVVE